GLLGVVGRLEQARPIVAGNITLGSLADGRDELSIGVAAEHADRRLRTPPRGLESWIEQEGALRVAKEPDQVWVLRLGFRNDRTKIAGGRLIICRCADNLYVGELLLQGALPCLIRLRPGARADVDDRRGLDRVTGVLGGFHDGANSLRCPTLLGENRRSEF